MLKEKGMTSNSFENNNIEQKTSGEIFEDVFNDCSLNNKNKLWISKESLMKIVNRYIRENTSKNNTYYTLSCFKLELLKELENK
jgi:hypothetical protein